MTDPLTRIRRSTSARLRNATLPECFRLASIAAEAHELAKPRGRRREKDTARAARKARKVSER